MKKFFEELSRRLREGGVESSNVEDRRLEIFLHGQPVLFVSPGNDVFLFPAGSNNPEASELYHRVAQTADEVYTYVEEVQTAPTLHISGLSEKFHLLADFGGAVLAGRELENGRGYQFVTWIWDYNRTGVSYGHYYDEDFCGAKQDFAVRSGLISKTQLFSPEELTELYSQIAPLQSEYKDWDEDLKARHGLEAQPAEEHPQFVAADLVCQRIGTRCKEVQPDRAAYQIPGLLLQYRNDLHWGRFDQAMEHMETMAALSLSVVLRECKQMGTALTVEQGVRFLESHILPHQNRSILKNRADEIAMQFQSVLAKNNRQGIRTQAEKKEVASAWLELAISCAKVPVKYEADEIKRRQKEEKTQRETEPVMA